MRTHASRMQRACPDYAERSGPVPRASSTSATNGGEEKREVTSPPGPTCCLQDQAGFCLSFGYIVLLWYLVA